MTSLLMDKSSGNLDIVVTNGALQTVSGDDELRQRLEFKLEFFQNDWFLDLLFGIPYYGRVFQRGVNIDDLHGIFTLAIEEEPGVSHVQTLDINIDASLRVLTVTGQALSDTGVEVEIGSTSGGIV